MSNDRGKDRPTERLDPPAAPAPGAPRAHRVLRVLDGESVATVALDGDGPRVIGRAAEADITIDAASVSRQHARLHVGQTLQIEDLGSANGTKVRGVRVEPGQRVDVFPGDEVEVGAVLCIAQGGGRAPGAPDVRALRTHEYFEARLHDECARVSRGALSRALGAAPAGDADRFTVARLRCEGAPPGVEAALLAALRPSEVAAWYGPGNYELLLPGAVMAESRLREVAAALERRGAAGRTGAAAWPRDGRTPDALLGRAEAALRPPTPDEALADADELVVEDESMRHLHRVTARVARSNISTLLLGEMGTGKEVFAQRLHRLSPRAAKPLMAVNCAVFTETLAEAELFGYEKGAFTGATAAKAGLLEAAEGGTVFLDEVGELSPAMQAKLLRAVQERKIRRMGGHEERNIDVRFVAATNRDLERAVDEGSFRGDLFFRLNGFTLEIPALRDRRAEVLPLARRFLAMAARDEGRASVPELSPEAAALLERYRWPGNVRELRNEMARAALLADGDVVTPEHLSSKLRVDARPTLKPAPTPPAPTPTPTPAQPATEALRLPDAVEDVRPLAEVRAGVEAAYVRRVLELCLHNQTRAAELLGLSRSQTVVLIERYKIPRPRS
ncbi:MAG: sigma 54-interacting transcriptional regulator [Polyangiales bacterium]